jgi:predicted RNA binding protein with dsRBD fold (UPF0201 family)
VGKSLSGEVNMSAAVWPLDNTGPEEVYIAADEARTLAAICDQMIPGTPDGRVISWV